MAFEDYKDLDLRPEEVDQEELKRLSEEYGVEIGPTPKLEEK